MQICSCCSDTACCRRAISASLCFDACQSNCIAGLASSPPTPGTQHHLLGYTNVVSSAASGNHVVLLSMLGYALCSLIARCLACATRHHCCILHPAHPCCRGHALSCGVWCLLLRGKYPHLYTLTAQLSIFTHSPLC